jgi:hypothetical protein
MTKYSGTGQAKILPVGRKTTKRDTDEGETWTVPVLVRIEDRETRWKAEDTLRKSNVHPAFHWPQGMLPYVKQYRKDLLDSGISDKDNYIRIRPEDRFGKLRIRGDVKPKAGGKFTARAYWDIPPMDAGLLTGNPALTKPQWVKQDTARKNSHRQSRNQSVSFAQDEEVMQVN